LRSGSASDSALVPYAQATARDAARAPASTHYIRREARGKDAENVLCGVVGAGVVFLTSSGATAVDTVVIDISRACAAISSRL
jgi:hypothetical protein